MKAELKMKSSIVFNFFVLWSFSLLRSFCVTTNPPCTEYCYHVRAGASNCYFDKLDKLQNACLQPLVHRRNVANLSLFCSYYFGRCSSELVELVALSYSRGRSCRYSDRLHDFSVTIPRCYKDIYVQQEFSAYRMPSFDLWSNWL